MSSFIKIIGIILLASVKYLFAAVPLLMTNTHWLEGMILCAIGGSIGVVFFTYLGEQITLFFQKKNLFISNFKRKRKFINLKNGYGLIGIALISPIAISIPVGCILSVAISNDRKKVMIYQLLSVVFWSILLFGCKGLFNFDLSKYLPFGTK
ncbi:MAG: hypothetical protein HQ463_01960 [Bacteroidetes bacterium]|nr:hypothetical protein [Bacteroidota bacterium]